MGDAGWPLTDFNLALLRRGCSEWQSLWWPRGLAQDRPKFVVEPSRWRRSPTATSSGTIEEAKAAATETGVPAEAGGKAWLLTLGPKDMALHGGEPVATFGPIQRFDAPNYLLRINVTDAPPGAKTSVHSHPGTEAIYILSGEATIRWPDRTDVADVGESLTGSPPHTPMEATSTGDETGRTGHVRRRRNAAVLDSRQARIVRANSP